MSNAAMWALIVGFFLPHVIAVVQQPGWSAGLRSFVMFLACMGAAIGTVLIQLGHWNWHDWVSSTLLILVTTIATYKGLWKPTGVSSTIEKSTSGTPRTSTT